MVADQGGLAVLLVVPDAQAVRAFLQAVYRDGAGVDRSPADFALEEVDAAGAAAVRARYPGLPG